MDITSITNRRIVTVLLAVVMLSSVFLYFSAPLPGISDFWWHVKSGQWIVEHGKLPTEDPFSFTTVSGPDTRKALVLRGYWLSQVVAYAAYKVLGFSGVVVLKATLFALIFLVLWRTLCMKGVEPVLALLLMAPLPVLLPGFDNPRPQIYSFLGAVLLFYCVEKGLKIMREGARCVPRSLLYLPLLTFVWANMHPGFIICYGMLGIYALTELLRFARGRDALSAYAIKKFMLIASAAAIATLINPNHVIAVTEAFATLGNPYNRTILENLPVWAYASARGPEYVLYAYIALAVVTAGFMAASWRTLKLSHVLLYAAFLVAGAMTFRYYIFFVVMGLATSAEYIATMTRSFARKIRPATIVLTIAAVAMVFSHSFRDGNLLNRRPLAMSGLPVKAVNFHKDKQLPAPIFNPYIWGGYMIWELYPDYGVFTDSRMIDFDAYRLYRRAMGGEVELLEVYGVNTVIIYVDGPLLQRQEGSLLASLAVHEHWDLVYFDGQTAIFVREGMAPDVRRLEKSYLQGLFR